MKKAVGLTLLSMTCVSASCFAEASVSQGGRLINTVLKRFEAVSCDKTATQCIAIGFGAEYRIHERFAYTSQDGGLTWNTPVLLASPKEEITPNLNEAPNNSRLECDEYGQHCIVTSSAIINKIPTPIVYSTNDGGLSWSAPKVLPLPKGIDKDQIYGNDSLWTDISCDKTSTFCTIAGTLAGSAEATPLVYSTNNAGETWKASSLKSASYQAPDSIYHGTFLTGISCNYSGLNCVAVGSSIIMTSYFGDFYGSYPVSYYTQDGGNHWSKPVVIDKEEINDINRGSTFVDVACDGAGVQCTAVGFSEDFSTSTTKSFSLISKNGGEDWEEKIVYIIPQDGGHVPKSIKCDASGKYCVVVGVESKLINRIPIQKSFIYTTNNSAMGWEKNTDNTFPNSSLLTDVFCNNEGDRCLAVGVQAEANNAIPLKRSKNMFSLHKAQLSKSKK